MGSAGVGCSQWCVGCPSWATGGVSGSGAGGFGVLGGQFLLLVVWFQCLVVTYGKMLKVVLPILDQLSHVINDVGNIAGWNGCVAAHSSDIGWCWAEVMKPA